MYSTNQNVYNNSLIRDVVVLVWNRFPRWSIYVILIRVAFLMLLPAIAIADHEVTKEYRGGGFEAESAAAVCSSVESEWLAGIQPMNCGQPSLKLSTTTLFTGSVEFNGTENYTCRVYGFRGLEIYDGENYNCDGYSDYEFNPQTIRIKSYEFSKPHEPEEEQNQCNAGSIKSFTISGVDFIPYQMCLGGCTATREEAELGKLDDGTWFGHGTAMEDGTHCEAGEGDPQPGQAQQELTEEQKCTGGYSTDLDGNTTCASTAGESGSSDGTDTPGGDTGTSDGGSTGGSSEGGTNEGGESEGGTNDGATDGGGSTGGSTDGGSSDGSTGGSTDGGSTDGGSIGGASGEEEECPENQYELVNGQLVCKSEVTPTTDPSGENDSDVVAKLEELSEELNAFDMTVPTEAPEFTDLTETLAAAQTKFDESLINAKTNLAGLVAVELPDGAYQCNRTLVIAGKTVEFCIPQSSLDLVAMLGAVFLFLAHLQALRIILEF